MLTEDTADLAAAERAVLRELVWRMQDLATVLPGGSVVRRDLLRWSVEIGDWAEREAEI